MVESIKERLERLQKSPPKVTLPFAEEEREVEVERRQPTITPETVYMRNIEKLMTNLETLKAKMKQDSGQYLSMYYDMKKAEKEFLDAINDPETKLYDLPDTFIHKVAILREKLANKKI